MRKVIQVGRKSKREGGEALRMAEQIDSRVELIQALIPLGLDAVKDLCNYSGRHHLDATNKMILYPLSHKSIEKKFFLLDSD